MSNVVCVWYPDRLAGAASSSSHLRSRSRSGEPAVALPAGRPVTYTPEADTDRKTEPAVPSMRRERVEIVDYLRIARPPASWGSGLHPLAAAIITTLFVCLSPASTRTQRFPARARRRSARATVQRPRRRRHFASPSSPVAQGPVHPAVGQFGPPEWRAARSRVASREPGRRQQHHVADLPETHDRKEIVPSARPSPRPRLELQLAVTRPAADHGRQGRPDKPTRLSWRGADTGRRPAADSSSRGRPPQHR